MSREEHISYWTKSAKDDWETVLSLFQTKRYVHSLFFAHLSLEKSLKAHWINANEDNFPPKTHNLVKLVQTSNLIMDDSTLDFLRQFNDFQLESRYPDYVFEINKRCTQQYTEQLLEQAKTIIQWLLDKI
jgi:HEPN domain-containing protein